VSEAASKKWWSSAAGATSLPVGCLVGGFGNDRRDSAEAQAGVGWRGRSKPVGADAMRAGVCGGWASYLIFDLREDLAALRQAHADDIARPTNGAAPVMVIGRQRSRRDDRRQR
jgi:hypothetical protein